MGILDNIVGGIKGLLPRQNQAIVNPMGQNQVVAGANNITPQVNQNNPYDELVNKGYSQDVINGVKQGLNGGDKYLANFIQNQGIRTPQTQAEIEQARAGNFNVPQSITVENTEITTPQTQQNNVINALQKLAPSNWDDTTRQKVLLASQFLSGMGATNYDMNANPLTNIAKGLAGGTQGALKQMQNYQNYQNTKGIYDQMGLDSSSLSPIGDYSSMTPAQIISLGIRQQSNKIRQDIANTSDNNKKLKLIMDNYNKGSISGEEAQALMKLHGLDVGQLQESNDTKKTNSQIEVNKARAEKLKADIQQNAQKISILKQRVAQGLANNSDKQELNRLNIENKKLIIEQNKLINQGLADQLGNNGGGNGGNITPTGRPLGQRNNNIKSF